MKSLKILLFVFCIFFNNNISYGNSFNSPVNHSIKEVSYCLSFYRMVANNEGLSSGNIDYINSHLNYLDFQDEILNVLFNDSKIKNKSADEIIYYLENSNQYNSTEKNFLIGFTNGKLDYITLNEVDRATIKFFCAITN